MREDSLPAALGSTVRIGP